MREPADCGFNEIPAVGHQGGSTISLSNYSKNKEAAWLFMQWVVLRRTIMARVSTLGGGFVADASTRPSPTRA